MSVAHKWLEQEPWPTKVMPKPLLESRIERVLTMTNIGYLGTVRKDGSPIVSPVEFYADGLALYIFPQPNSPGGSGSRGWARCPAWTSGPPLR